ncbi:MAG: peptide/nickel transport system permease protein [Gaiellales bacterium]|jgi:peptide/nickel transport system permease protein|nr:peptide/nickel transport system permease protein [Gaiellales bacterium]
MAEAVPSIDPTTPVPVLGGPSEKQIARRQTIRLLAHQPEFIIGAVVILIWVICAVGGEALAPKDPYEGNPAFSHVGPGSDGGAFVLGTDRLGRDVFSRIIVGARDVLIVAPISALIGVGLGTLLGLVMGYYRGLVDDILSRIVEAFLSLPVTLVALLTLVVLGPSIRTVIGVVGLLFAPIVARTVRAAVLAERELDYVAAAKLRGESGLVIMGREILPNVTGPIVVELTVRVGYAIFTISTLSFLGVGLQPPSPDWGLQISEEYSMIINGYWWTVLFPSIAIASLVVATNLIADALQAVLHR